MRFLNRFSTFNPAVYWERRHRRFGTSLASVGHVLCSEGDNQADYAIKLERLAGALERTVGPLPGKSVLDAGCGIGLMTEMLVARGAVVTAVDISPSAIHRANERVPGASFHCCALDKIGFIQEFDAVCTMDVLFHVVDDHNWEEALRRMVRALKKGGALLIQEELHTEAEPAPHVRWRTLEVYEKAMAPLGISIFDLESYQLSKEGARKDILICRMK